MGGKASSAATALLAILARPFLYASSNNYAGLSLASISLSSSASFPLQPRDLLLTLIRCAPHRSLPPHPHLPLPLLPQLDPPPGRLYTELTKDLALPLPFSPTLSGLANDTNSFFPDVARSVRTSPPDFLHEGADVTVVLGWVKGWVNGLVKE
jgi:hypothetical protein